MIVDRPAPKDFERQSIQYLIQSIDLITSNDHKDEDIEDYEVDMAECWKYHQGTAASAGAHDASAAPIS